MSYYKEVQKMKNYVEEKIKNNKKTDQKGLEYVVFRLFAVSKKSYIDFIEELRRLNFIKTDQNNFIWIEKND